MAGRSADFDANEVRPRYQAIDEASDQGVVPTRNRDDGSNVEFLPGAAAKSVTNGETIDGLERLDEPRIGYFLRCCLGLTAVVGVLGCGEGGPLNRGQVHPVTGKVLLPDGNPLTSGKVVFVATKSTISSLAKIQNDGSFTINGLPEGEYKVRLEVGESSHAKKGSPPFPSKYLDEDGSDLAATVKPDETANRFELKLTQNGPKSSPRGSR